MENTSLQNDKNPYEIKHGSSSSGPGPSINRLLGNQAMIQRITREHADAFSQQHNLSETMSPGQKAVPIIQRKGWGNWIKKILKSSIWGALVGLSYCLLGCLSTAEATAGVITAGTLVGILCIIVNIGSIVINILGAMGKLDTEPVDRNDEELQGGGEKGLQIAGGAGGAVGSAVAAVADLIYIIQSSKGMIDEICGAIAEIISVIKGVISLISNSISNDRSTSEKVIKSLKYCADIIAGTIGTIAFITAISNPGGALPLFIGEVCIRGVRFMGSLIATIIDWYKKKKQAALAGQREDGQNQDLEESPALRPASPPPMSSPGSTSSEITEPATMDDLEELSGQ